MDSAPRNIYIDPASIRYGSGTWQTVPDGPTDVEYVRSIKNTMQISLTADEILEGVNRLEAAEHLIIDLPIAHPGRKIWLRRFAKKNGPSDE